MLLPVPLAAPALLGGGAKITLTQVASATSTVDTITGPAEIIAGDLLVLLDYATSASTPSTVVPTGFVAIANQTSATSRVILSAKIADGSEANASLTGMDGTSSDRKALYVFRGTAPLTAYVANDVGGESTSGDPTAQTVNASGAEAPLIILGGYAAPNPVDPRTFSPAEDGELSPSTSLFLKYKIYNSAPQDTTIDMDDEGAANILVSTYITVTG